MSDRRNSLRAAERPTPDRTRSSAGTPQSAAQGPPSATDGPRSASKTPRSTTDAPRPTADAPRPATDTAQPAADRARSAADPDQPAADRAQRTPGADQPEADHARSAAHGDIGAEEISQAADALFFAMRRARSTGAEHYGGLSLPQVALLEPLATEKDLPVGRLASSAGVSVPTATRMLQQLEGKGIVARRRSPEDERRVLVSLTDDGAERLAGLRGHLRERQARAYEAFTPAERALLVTLLHRLTDLVADTGSG
ncbi:MarR family transcriptional regulator [Streptomyces sp. AM6-12]|uniref:MarR family winged helix-turn-helix transcriptional regulator n=1 Tax=Streptomyces sp. AM6-12 TaxID=3345149 RepID=UPI0037ADAF61